MLSTPDHATLAPAVPTAGILRPRDRLRNERLMIPVWRGVFGHAMVHVLLETKVFCLGPEAWYPHIGVRTVALEGHDLELAAPIFCIDTAHGQTHSEADVAEICGLGGPLLDIRGHFFDLLKVQKVAAGSASLIGPQARIAVLGYATALVRHAEEDIGFVGADAELDGWVVARRMVGHGEAYCVAEEFK